MIDLNNHSCGHNESKERIVSLKSFLTGVMCACSLPLAALAIYLGVYHVRTVNDQVDRQAGRLAKNISTIVDHDIEIQIERLRTVAISPLLDDPPNLEDFHREARSFHENFGSHIGVTDSSMKIRAHSAQEPGTPLPTLKNSQDDLAASRALSSGKPAVGNLVFGPVVGRLVVAVAMPMNRNGTHQFVIFNVLEQDHVKSILDKLTIPIGIRATVLDGKDDVIAFRNTIESDGTSYEKEHLRRFQVKSGIAPWSVLVEIPQSVYRAPVVYTLSVLLAVLSLALLFIAFGSTRAAGRISRSLSRLAQGSLQQGAGLAFTEIENVRQELVRSRENTEAAMKELRQKEETLRLFIEHSPAAMAMFDRGMAYLAVSQQFRKAFHLEETDLIGRSHYEVFPGIPKSWREEHKKALTGEVIESAELSFVTTEGEVKWLRRGLRPWYASDQSVGGIILFADDVTQRKLNEDALATYRNQLEKMVEERTSEVEKSRRLLRSIIDGLPVAITYLDCEGRYVFSNKTHQAWWKRSSESIVGSTLRQVISEGLDRAESNLSVCLGGHERTSQMSFTFGDGVTRDIWIRLIPDTDSSGKVTGAITLMIDMTDHKKVESELRKAEKKFREITELLPQPIWETDINGNFTFGNTALLELAEVSRDELLDNFGPAQMVIHEDAQRVTDDMKAVIRDRTKSILEVTVVQKDGSLVPCLVYTVPVVEEDEVVGFRGVTIDVGPLKRAEADREQLRKSLFESQKLASLGTLVGGLAHDFNNIFQIITGYSEILMDHTPRSSKSHSDLKHIFDTSMQGADLIKKLLAFGQQAQVVPEPINLNSHLIEIKDLIAKTLPIGVEIDIDTVDEPTTILADTKQIAQVIGGLVNNASEAMPDGGRISILTRISMLDDDFCLAGKGCEPGEYVRLTVSDTGRGMDAQTVSQIFDPFFSTKQRGTERGTGLGLSVVRGIVQQQGGFVDCFSEPGKGSTFDLYFPRIEAPAVEIETNPETLNLSGTETILLVEDVSFIADLERDIFESEGYKAIIANSGIEAVRLFRQMRSEISLVALDLVMPVMSGKQCLQELRKIDPDVRVLVVSGCSSEDDIFQQVRPFVKGFVHKPCRKDDLLKAVRIALDA